MWTELYFVIFVLAVEGFILKPARNRGLKTIGYCSFYIGLCAFLIVTYAYSINWALNIN